MYFFAQTKIMLKDIISNELVCLDKTILINIISNVYKFAQADNTETIQLKTQIIVQMVFENHFARANSPRTKPFLD